MCDERSEVSIADYYAVRDLLEIALLRACSTICKSACKSPC